MYRHEILFWSWGLITSWTSERLRWIILFSPSPRKHNTKSKWWRWVLWEEMKWFPLDICGKKKNISGDCKILKQRICSINFRIVTRKSLHLQTRYLKKMKYLHWICTEQLDSELIQSIINKNANAYLRKKCILCVVLYTKIFFLWHSF